MGRTRCIRCEKFRHNFVARTFSLIAPVQPKLLRVLYSNKMILNALKSYETHQNMSLGSNGVDQVCLLQKFLMRLRRPNFCINCNSSAYFAPSFVQQWNAHKCSLALRNTRKCQFRVQWGGSGAFVLKNSNSTSWYELLHYFGPFCTEFRKTTKQSQMHPNGTKCSKTIV